MEKFRLPEAQDRGAELEQVTLAGLHDLEKGSHGSCALCEDVQVFDGMKEQGCLLRLLEHVFGPLADPDGQSEDCEQLAVLVEASPWCVSSFLRPFRCIRCQALGWRASVTTLWARYWHREATLRLQWLQGL